MRVAELVGVHLPSMRFTYALSALHLSRRAGRYYESDTFEIFSREGFTKVWDANHREVVKTLGIRSHADVLEDLGYIRAVNLGVVQDCTDEELLAFACEFEKTGDDLSPFLWEVENR